MPINFLTTMTNGNIPPIALQNMINAKLAQLIGSKGVTFKQYSHSKPMVPNYYSICFLGSGVGKDMAADLINDYLMPFLGLEQAKQIEHYKQQLADEAQAKHTNDSKKNKELDARAAEAIERVRPFNLDIADATFTAVYSEAEQISKVGSGAICIRISELGDFIDNITGGDANKKELLEKLKDMYDGKVMPRLISGDKRANLNNIPINALLYSDFKNLLDEKNNVYFKKMLETGLARRAFIYIPDGHIKINKPIGFAAKEKAQEHAINLCNDLCEVYKSIPQNACYTFNETAKVALQEYQDSCVDQYNELIECNQILATDVHASFWKITKLAVIYHVVENPTTFVIGPRYVQQAIDFYNEIKPCLKLLIDKRADSPEDRLKKWLKNQTKPFKRTEIKNQKFVNDNRFSKWLDEVMPQVCDEIKAETGVSIFEYKGFGGNTKAYQTRKGVACPTDD